MNHRIACIAAVAMLTVLSSLARGAKAPKIINPVEVAKEYARGTKALEIIDPAEAAKDPDFAFQGEYLGQSGLEGTWKGKIGVQVIARGKGKLEAFVLAGGLPGEGWKKGNARVRLEGERQAGEATLSGNPWSARIRDNQLTLKNEAGQVVLEKVERRSPTLAQKAPQGAVVLLGDGGLAHFEKDAHRSPTGELLSGTTTLDKFTDCTLHLEFRLSWMPEATGQGRSNSGVYLHDAYEIQVLDSFGLTGENNECGGFYSIKAPDVNMCLPPMVWQTYDIEFAAPKYDAAGTKTANARLTVRHNGVVIHDRMELPKGTPGRKPEGPGPRPIHLQGHGNKVQYRNFWVLSK